MVKAHELRKTQSLERLFIAEAPLNDFTDALDPSLHRFALNRVEKRSEFVKQLVVLLEVIEVLVDPMLHADIQTLTCLY